MKNYHVIVLAAGQGKRMKAGRNKQFIQLAGKPLIIHTLSVFEQDDDCSGIILVSHPDEQGQMEEMVKGYGLQKVSRIVPGGKERQDSVYNGLMVFDQETIVLIHDGARPFIDRQSIHRLVAAVDSHGAALLGVKVTDTMKLRGDQGICTLDRNRLWAAQTPQGFSLSIIRNAHEKAREEKFLGTDDASLVERLGKQVTIVEGSYDNIKITTPEDLKKAEMIIQQTKYEGSGEDQTVFRVGQGFDVHQLAEGRRCMIGGVDIPHEKGLVGHSDADVLLHTIADACLGAIGEGDIGKHFPDTDVAYKDADSKDLLREVWSLVQEKGYQLGNLDCTIIAQAPKMAPYIDKMRTNIAEILQANASRINVKATTTENLGFTGRKEGIAAQAVILLQKNGQ
ncbi:2-C-methyl-D-erythritol 2,4-cyclodiphosphate synthase [Melghiribacillus thermohalophilus]|uniref:Bifunctional enzyme IspD/IspF n=1 Tax=Melghiribacillus thermohalophilus TaxID=1324956 RepID=A0A4V2V1G3_9BACI|nr:bifunctional 2-C-methyl-D-erythritol 4-phosphate cytidylyltransferase/2-C-methyl-D-erythritol 2,4-cyclodiphosphate synthase [Melghiribacillus thermohalophilus]TCT21052.1 2-C-methyl-D-erythritol 2,4-cyclodiphosphate synthase [Melghiribacillus thermohalophilus]